MTPPLADPAAPVTAADNSERLLSRGYRCRCGRPIFFPNSECLGCKAPLGYEPILRKVLPLTPDADGVWRADDVEGLYRRCANLDSAAKCNWILPSTETNQTLCKSCRLNRTIPDLSIAENQEFWSRIEFAKRRLISTLLGLGFPVESRLSEDTERGLAFDLLAPVSNDAPVQTGHANGIITLNIREADDSHREFVRELMHEPYRTLLGHLRHESGHYYWDRLVDGTRWLDGFRKIFGDERQDYAEALQRHYANGAPADWQQKFVSTYASSHPWEDWAESWAQYLHVVDTLHTAASYEMDFTSVDIPVDPFGRESLSDLKDPQAASFLEMINSWVRFTTVLNELSRSMGLRDFYPFVLSRSAVAKLHFIHTMTKSRLR